ncbi:MAG TPA: hypothetical protein V6C81_10630 [Planktothrix sp.]|jgi:hypothetical protein
MKALKYFTGALALSAFLGTPAFSANAHNTTTGVGHPTLVAGICPGCNSVFSGTSKFVNAGYHTYWVGRGGTNYGEESTLLAVTAGKTPANSWQITLTNSDDNWEVDTEWMAPDGTVGYTYSGYTTSTHNGTTYVNWNASDNSVPAGSKFLDVVFAAADYDDNTYNETVTSLSIDGVIGVPDLHQAKPIIYCDDSVTCDS